MWGRCCSELERPMAYPAALTCERDKNDARAKEARRCFALWRAYGQEFRATTKQNIVKCSRGSAVASIPPLFVRIKLEIILEPLRMLIFHALVDFVAVMYVLSECLSMKRSSFEQARRL